MSRGLRSTLVLVLAIAAAWPVALARAAATGDAAEGDVIVRVNADEEGAGVAGWTQSPDSLARLQRRLERARAVRIALTDRIVEVARVRLDRGRLAFDEAGHGIAAYEGDLAVSWDDVLTVDVSATPRRAGRMQTLVSGTVVGTLVGVALGGAFWAVREGTGNASDMDPLAILGGAVAGAVVGTAAGGVDAVARGPELVRWERVYGGDR